MNSVLPRATDRVNLFVLDPGLYLSTQIQFEFETRTRCYCPFVKTSTVVWIVSVGEALDCGSGAACFPRRKSDQALWWSPTHTFGLEPRIIIIFSFHSCDNRSLATIAWVYIYAIVVCCKVGVDQGFLFSVLAKWQFVLLIETCIVNESPDVSSFVLNRNKSWKSLCTENKNKHVLRAKLV